MSTQEPELKSPSPEEFSSASRTLFAVNLLVAVIVSVWIPLRIVYSRHAPHMAAADRIVDLTVLGLIAANLAHRRWSRRGRQALESAPVIVGTLVTDVLVALPLSTLLAPFLGDHACYALLVKLLLVRHVFSVPRLLDEFANLHPVLARLIPVGFILPITVNLLACGWS